MRVKTMHSMFDDLTLDETKMLYEGLLSLLKSDSNWGIVKGSKGEEVYRKGAKDGSFDYETGNNAFFWMMLELSDNLRDTPYELSQPVNCWSEFCKVLVESYDEHHPQPGK